MWVHLDKYKHEYERDSIGLEHLHNEFWQPKYSTGFYETHRGNIDRLLGSALCLQIHYYYSLIRKLNELTKIEDSAVTADFVKGYLEQESHIFCMGIGAVDALLGKQETKDALQSNLKSLIQNFNDPRYRRATSTLLKSYGQNG